MVDFERCGCSLFLFGTSKLRGWSRQSLFWSRSASTRTVESKIQVDSHHVCRRYGSSQWSHIRLIIVDKSFVVCFLKCAPEGQDWAGQVNTAVFCIVFLWLKLEYIAKPQFLQAFAVPRTKDTFSHSGEISLFLNVFHTLCIFKVWRVSAKWVRGHFGGECRGECAGK